MTAPIPLFKGEAMLLSWGDTSSRGKTVSFALHEDECREGHPFRGLGTGKHGQRFALVAVPIDDEDRPLTNSPGASVVEPAAPSRGLSAAGDTGASPHKIPVSAPGEAKRGRTLPEKVGMLCNDRTFWRWIDGKRGTAPGVTDAQDAATWVRRECGVESRKEILPGTPACWRWNEIVLEFEGATNRMAEAR